MKALILFNAATLALMATFAMTLGVVCILYAFHLDELPRMRSEWHQVSQLTGVFALLTAVSAWAFWSQWRRLDGRWLAEALLVLALAGGSWWMLRILS